MHLASALNLNHADEIDVTRPLDVLHLQLGSEAAQEAARIIRLGTYGAPVLLQEKTDISDPIYWQVIHNGVALGEIFGFPGNDAATLFTAIEIGIIRALDNIDPALREKIVMGGHLIVIGTSPEMLRIKGLIEGLSKPAAGMRCVINNYSQIRIGDSVSAQLSATAIQCFHGSVTARPLKFRFLELYRVMEARFLAEIKKDLLAGFDAEPRQSLEEALKRLKSEVVQFANLADGYREHFEMVRFAIDAMHPGNSLSAALNRKLGLQSAEIRSTPHRCGAALIYYLRCAVVHAGEKDMIYENYSDGDELLEACIEYIEEASLAVAGIQLA